MSLVLFAQFAPSDQHVSGTHPAHLAHLAAGCRCVTHWGTASFSGTDELEIGWVETY